MDSIRLIRGKGNNISSNVDLFGRGLYLTDDTGVAKFYGDTIVEYNITGKIFDTKKEFTSVALRRLLRAIDKALDTNQGSKLLQEITEYNGGRLPKQTDSDYLAIVYALDSRSEYMQLLEKRGLNTNEFLSQANVCTSLNLALKKLGYVGLEYSTNEIEDLEEKGLGDKNAYVIFDNRAIVKVGNLKMKSGGGIEEIDNKTKDLFDKYEDEEPINFDSEEEYAKGGKINESIEKDYSKWKRKNVTYRGIKSGNNLDEHNNVYGSFGRGLYTVPLSNKAMAKGYGDVFFVINAIPKNPKIVDSLNNAELWRQKLINDFCKRHGEQYSSRYFEANTTIEKEMLGLGYDGLIIKGREVVNYTPDNIKYFKTENEVINYHSQLSNQFEDGGNIQPSTDSMQLYQFLKNKYPAEIFIDRPSGEYYENIEINIKDEGIRDLLMIDIKNHNWHKSKSYGNRIEISPIYSKAKMDNIPLKLYHATAIAKVESILKDGLNAKNESVREKYPDRIYVTETINLAEILSKQLSKWKDYAEYTVLEIDTHSLKFDLYKDLSCAYDGCYYIQGLDIIPSENIRVVKHKNLNVGGSLNEEVANFKRKYAYVKEVEFDITPLESDVNRWFENNQHPQDKATIEYLLTQDLDSQPPIIIGKYSGKYKIIDGWHRIYAALKQGKIKLKALIEPDVESTDQALTEIFKTDKTAYSKIAEHLPDIYDMQDSTAERILERSFKPSRVWTYKIENAGDIIRELTKYNGVFIDPSYLYEKVNKIDKFLKEQENQRDVHPDDSYFQFKRQNQQSVNDFVTAYTNLPTLSEAQRQANSLVLALLDGNIQEAKKYVDYFNRLRKGRDVEGNLMKANRYEIAAYYRRVKRRGNNPELVAAVEEVLTQNNFKNGGNIDALKDVDSTTKALDGIRNINIVGNVLDGIDLYHGTTSEIDFIDFDLTKGSKTDEGYLGQGVYLTRYNWAAKQMGNGARKVINVKAILNNPFIFKSMREDGIKSFHDAIKKIGYNGDYSSKDITDFLKSKKHDGVMAATELVPFRDINGNLITQIPYEDASPQQIAKEATREYLIFDQSKAIIDGKQISEAYHKAKAGGSNPELVKAVEDAIMQPKLGKGGNVNALDNVAATTKALEELDDATFDKWINNQWSRLDIDLTDKIAFGFSADEITKLNPSRLTVKWQDDFDNAGFQQEKSGLSKKGWARTVNLSEPIEVSYDGYKFNIEDGHHRYYAALILNKVLPVSLEIKANPTVEVIRNRYKISKAYHKAKADGSNPELVEAVENLLKDKETLADGGNIDASQEIERTVSALEVVADNNPKQLSKLLDVDVSAHKRDIDGGNYFQSTRATFKKLKWGQQAHELFNELKVQDGVEFIKSPNAYGLHSQYLVDTKNEIIYRLSDHWGNFASVKWNLDEPLEVWQLRKSPVVLAKANFSDFTDLAYIKFKDNKHSILKEIATIYYHSKKATEDRYKNKVFVKLVEEALSNKMESGGTINALEEEAKKYNSAEKFVNAQLLASKWRELQKQNPDLFNIGILRRSLDPFGAEGVIPTDVHTKQYQWQNYGQDDEVEAEIIYGKPDNYGYYNDKDGNPITDIRTGDYIKDEWDYDNDAERIKATISNEQLKNNLIDSFSTEEGKEYLKEVVSALPKNPDGSITAYRIGQIGDGAKSYTLSEGMAKTFSNQGTDIMPAGLPSLPNKGYSDFGALPLNVVNIDTKGIVAWCPYDSEILVESKYVKTKSQLIDIWNKAHQEESFKNWFDKSVVVDNMGNPLILWHGSRTNITVFDKQLAQIQSQLKVNGFHFGSKSQAKMRNSEYLIPVYLKIDKIKTVKDNGGGWFAVIEKAKQEGYDGIKYLNRYEGIPHSEYQKAAEINTDFKSSWDLDKFTDSEFKKMFPSAEYSYIVFEPTQIKIADGTNTKFDINNPDIRYENGGIIVPEMQSETFLKYDVVPVLIQIDSNGYVFESGRRMYSANNYADGYDYIKRHYPEIIEKFINPKPKKEKRSSDIFPQALILKRSGVISKQQMIKEGATGSLSTAFERYIPIDKIEGEDPENASWTDDEGFVQDFEKGIQIKTPIEVIYENEFDRYVLMNGNHRLTQARMNGQRYIAAYVQPDKGSIGGNAKLKNPDLKYEKGGIVDLSNYETIISSPEFIKYFGNWANAYKVAGLDFSNPAWTNVSKIVDESGKPLIMYRGQMKSQDEIGYVFKKGLEKLMVNKNTTNTFGFFFVSSINTAIEYAGGYRDEKTISGSLTKVFLNCKNILDLTELGFNCTEKQFLNFIAQRGVVTYKRGNNNIASVWRYFDTEGDSLAYDIQQAGYDSVKYLDDTAFELDNYSIVVFNSNQIKLSTGENTTFDRNNTDIRLEKGGRTYWGNVAAGCLFYSKKTGKVLVAYRSSDVYEPNTWGTWGGKTDGDETILDALDREIREETECYCEYEAIPVYVYKDSNFEYHNYLTIIEDEFTPALNWETQDYCWCDINNLPKKLHFGLKLALPYFKEVIASKFEKGGSVESDYVEVINGFYSPLEKMISETKYFRLPVKQWIDKFGNSEEAKWTGLHDWLASQKESLTKEDILKYLKENRVRIEVIEKTTNSDKIEKLQLEYEALQNEIADMHVPEADKAKEKARVAAEKAAIGGVDHEETLRLRALRDKEEEKMRKVYDKHFGHIYKKMNAIQEDIDGIKRWSEDDSDEVKYEQYQTEGRKWHYKEILVILPKIDIGNEFEKLHERFGLNKIAQDKHERKYAKLGRDERMEVDLVLYSKDKELYRQYQDLIKKTRNKSESIFKTKHFEEHNILLHARISTREDIESHRIIFIQELQSDWQQSAKKEGFTDFDKLNDLRNQADIVWHKLFNKNGQYKDGLDPADKKQLLAERDRISDEISDLEEKEVIPKAPFITDTVLWVKLAFKVILRIAVSEGISKIAWATGEQNNELFDLSKTVSSVDYTMDYESGIGHLQAWNLSGNDTVIDESVKLNELHKYVGKYVAEDIRKQIESKEGKWRSAEVVGDALSIVYGGGVRIKGKIASWQVKKMEETKQIASSLATGGNIPFIPTENTTYQEWERKAQVVENIPINRNSNRAIYNLHNNIVLIEDEVSPANFLKPNKTYSRLDLQIKSTQENRELLKKYNGEIDENFGYTEDGYGLPLFMNTEDAFNFAKERGTKLEQGGLIGENKETYNKWKSLVNMSKSELQKFYDSKEGKEAGLSAGEAKSEVIDSGRESARWIIKMKDTNVSEWTPDMWRWAKKQISFISRMSGNKGGLYDDKGNKTRKHTSLLIWGHDPEKKNSFERGGEITIAFIVKSLANEYLENYPEGSKVCDINTGDCPTFAEDLEAAIIESGLGNHNDTEVLSTDSFYEIATDMSKDDSEGADDDIWLKLEDYNSTYPKDLKWKKDNYHVWVYHKGKHYDAEAPNGVVNLFDLPIFKKMVKTKMEEGGSITPDKYEEIIYSANFVSWFGDWKNDPQNASKITGENNKPQIVYHGTPYGRFNTFKNNGAIFFSESSKFARDYGDEKAFDNEIDDDVRVLEVFLNIRNPFDIKNDAHREKLSALLPDMIGVGLFGKQFSKEVFINGLLGNCTLQPYWSKEKVDKAKFGHIIGDARDGFNNDIFIGIDKDNNVIYVAHYLQDIVWLLTEEQRQELIEGKTVTANGYKVYSSGRLYSVNELRDAYRNKEITEQEWLSALGSGHVSSKKVSPLKESQEIEECTGQDTWQYYELNNVDLIDKIKELGFDGLRIQEKGESNIVAFYPSQIKFATGENVLFDGNNADMRLEKGGEIDIHKDALIAKLNSFSERIKNKKFPNIIEFVEVVLPRQVALKYKDLYEIAAKVGIMVNIEIGCLIGSDSCASWQYGSINIDPNVILREDLSINEVAELINHEVIHALLTHGINYNRYQLHLSLLPVFNIIINDFDNIPEDIKYIVSYIIDTSKEISKIEDFETGKKTLDLEELITYSFTDKEFAKYLDSKTSIVKEEDKKPSVFTTLKTIIRDDIGYHPNNKTLLDDICNIVEINFDIEWDVKQYGERNEKYGWNQKFNLFAEAFEKGGTFEISTKPIFRKASNKYNIYEVVADTSNQVARIFVRFAEHYDNKDFKNKIFTLEEFKKYYSGDGEFTYYDEWYGYNIPDYGFKRFLDGGFNPLSVEEQWLVDQIKEKVDLKKPFYIVGYSKDDSHAHNHELSHALYYLSFTYKDKTNAVVKDIPQSELQPLNRFLAQRKYDQSVLRDEMIAYLMADKEFLKKGGGWSDAYEPYHKKLVRIYSEYNSEIKQFSNGGRINKSNLFRQDFWTQRVPFLESFNFFNNLPEHTSVLFQKAGEDYNRTTVDNENIKIGNFFEFAVGKHDYYNFTEWGFVIKPTIFLRNPNTHKLTDIVLISVMNMFEDKYRVDYTIKTKLATEPTKEEVDKAVAEVNKGFFELENFANNFGSELNFKKGGVVAKQRKQHRSEVRKPHRSQIRPKHRSEARKKT